MSGLTLKRFTPKPQTVEAVQVTEDNMDEAAAWCGGEVWESPIGLCVALPSGVTCHPRDWVVRLADGTFDGGPRQHFPDDDGWEPALPSTAQPVEYRLCPVPFAPELPDAYLWDVVVRRCFSQDDGSWTDDWEVRSTFGRCLGSDGYWRAHERGWPMHRFSSLGDAMAAADDAQWTLRVNGKTARDVLTEREGTS